MSNQPTIVAALIVKGTKDEAELLSRCLASINGYVDGIYLNINHLPGQTVAQEVLAVAEKFHTIHEITEWTGNFVEARKTVFAMVPKEIDWIMTLDADDTIDKPEELRNIVAIASPQQQGIYVKYDYDHDEFGNVTVAHWVARIVRNNGSYIWKSSISDGGVAVHETLNEVIPRAKAMCKDFRVIHHADEERRQVSLERNIELLEGMYERQQSEGEVDPRTLFYLATHYYDAGNLGSAVELLRDYLLVSGWSEERCEARLYLGNILRKVHRDMEAKEEYLKAIGEYQNSPRPYVELAELEFADKRFEESASWIEKCLQLPAPTTTMVLRPMESSYKAYMLAAQAYVNLGGKKLDKASEYIQKALKLRPNDPDAQRARDMIEGLVETREDIRAATRLIRKYEQEKQPEKILQFIQSLPADVQDNPLVINARNQHTEPRIWPKKSIALYVGNGPLGIWGPWSLEEGIGGSEEAVIRLSRELAIMGWQVTIYATPGERAGIFRTPLGNEYAKNFGSQKAPHYADEHLPGGGIAAYYEVEWKQYYEFNPHDEYDVLIAWRNPGFFDATFKARKQYLWLHDLMEKEEFLPERLEKIDKVIFVGQYHADYYKGIIPENKWFVSGNGIVPEDFSTKPTKRTKHRMVYMSAHNRGLKILVDNWKKIKKAVPDATLDIYYGWESYDAINRDNPERMAWKQELVSGIKANKGMTDHGRISQDQIVREIESADLLAYPAIFPEVYCLTYVKAMAGGAFPVTTDYAELAHYADDGGIQVHYEPGQLQELIDDYIAVLITTLKEGVTNDMRTNMQHTAKQKYSWKSTANSWSDEMS